MNPILFLKLVAYAFVCAMTAAGPAHAANYEAAIKMVIKGQFTQALSQFEELAAEGNAASQYSIGLIYHLGHGVQRNPETAYHWYKKSALQHYPRALNNIGMMYLNGEYVAKNEAVGFKLIEMASSGLAIAKNNLANCYKNGLGTTQDTRMAMIKYKEAGDAGYTLGWYHLAEMYEKGSSGIEKDIDQAVQFYTLAADKNLKPARDKLNKLSRLSSRTQKADIEFASTQ